MYKYGRFHFSKIKPFANVRFYRIPETGLFWGLTFTLYNSLVDDAKT